MNEFEMELKQLMTDRAGSVGVFPEMGRTLRKARVRRVANAGVGLLTIVAVATVSVAGVQAFTRTETTRTDVVGEGHSTDGEFGFTSVPGEYPTVASGGFRGAEWELTSETISKDGIDSLAVQFQLTEGGATVVDDLEVLATDDVMVSRHVQATQVLDGTHVVYGVTIRGVDSVGIEVVGGKEATIEPHRFLGYDSRSTMTVDFFLAFVPGDAPGFVHARNELGIDVDLAPYGGISLAPHVVASGTVPSTGVAWSLEFAALEQDRACLVFDSESECFSPQQLADAEPLHMVTFERNNILVVAAILSGRVGNVQIELDGRAVDLPWFQPEQEDLANWPIRMVAVGLEPDTHGTLQATLGDSDILAEERF